ncbi:MAG: cysteine dioxygenase family protein [Chloroflexi bacterium]|nr:cysteine dioxygenase family protein [Chloroflexota bacterium]
MTTSTYTLEAFVQEARTLVAAGTNSDATLSALADPLERIIARPDCLTDFEGVDTPSPDKGFVIHRSQELTVLAVVWPAGGSAPIHNHNGWAMEGVIAGEELNHNYARVDDGLTPWQAKLEAIDPSRVRAGETTFLPDPPADIHSVEIPSGKTVAIHLYGLDLLNQWRYRFDLETGAVTPFRARIRD